MNVALSAKSKAVLLTLFFFCLSAAAPRAVFAQKSKIKQASAPPSSSFETDKDFAADEAKIFALVNDERAKRGLSALVFDADIAREYSKKMARENFFSHFDGAGESVVERARKARLKHWSKIGENLFSVENLARFDRFAVKNWMRSPAHKQNILDPDFTRAGVGVARSEKGEIFITQVFIKK